jgi:hypothetical protein
MIKTFSLSSDSITLNTRFSYTKSLTLPLGFRSTKKKGLINRCEICYQKPILGVCFKCSNCPKFSVCQTCYFRKDSPILEDYKTHRQDHSFELYIIPQKLKKRQICNFCELEIEEVTLYKCQVCFSFYFCQACYAKKNYFKTKKATTHKLFHPFIKIEP